MEFSYVTAWSSKNKDYYYFNIRVIKSSLLTQNTFNTCSLQFCTSNNHHCIYSQLDDVYYPFQLVDMEMKFKKCVISMSSSHRFSRGRIENTSYLTCPSLIGEAMILHIKSLWNANETVTFSWDGHMQSFMIFGLKSIY